MAGLASSVTGTQSIERALNMLRLVSDRPRTVAELVSAQSLPRPTVSRLLRALEQHGYVARRSDRRIYLGTMPLSLADSWRRNGGFPDLLQDFVEAVVQRLRETSLVCVREHMHSICVARAEPERVMRLSAPIGARNPMHAGAVHRILLAYSPPSIVERVLSQSLKKYTDRTVIEPRKIRQRLELVRRRGYDYSEGEIDAGACSVAVPIRDRTGKALYSICFAGPAERIRRAGLNQMRDEFTEMVRKFSRQRSMML